MPMMAKMRSLAPTFIVGVGVIFVLFMIVSDSNIMEIFGLRTNNVGSINGVKISYQDFVRAMDNERATLKQQGKQVPDEENEQFRDEVWNALVTQTLVAQQIKKFGITVSDQEIRNIILSNNPPEFLKRNFIDSTGKFNRQLYLNALYNPQNSQALIQAEDYIRQSELSQKLQSMLLASITVSEADVKRAYIDQNTKANAQYALINISEFPVSTIKVTNDELNNYYNKHQNLYEIIPQRRLKYVLFSTVPSADDSANVKLNLENIVNQSGSDTTSFETLVNDFSTVPYSKDTLAINAFPASASDSIINSKPGSIIGPFASQQGYVVYHVLGAVQSNQTMVRASHILINQYGSDANNLEEANKIYDELQRGGNFAQLAKEYSKDPGSAIRGGDLGWFGKGQMVPEFEKAAFSGKVGVVQKPIKTNYGYHIIKVTGKIDKKFIVEKLVNPIKTSTATRDQILSNAKDFNYIAKKDGFDKEAKMMEYVIRQTPPFSKEYNYVPGIGYSENLTKFAFGNGMNTISDPIRTQMGYVVAEVSGIIKEGVRPLSEVKVSVRASVIGEKRFELARKQAEFILSKIGGDLSKAPSVDSKVTVSQTGEFTPGSGSVPNLGIDYSFTANVLKLPINKVSEPVRGNSGYYLIDVLSRTPFDKNAFEAQENTIRASILQQKRNQFFQEWLADLQKNADIVDNRSQFFQE